MKLFTKSPMDDESFHVLFDQPDAVHDLGVSLRRRLVIRPANTEVVFMCIGTDRSTGDALGPLVGSYLLESLPATPVYGTLDKPVHAVNLSEAIAKVENEHVVPFVIAIDACLGQVSNLGQITLSEGALHPGAGVHKKLPQIGDLHITGVVNVGGFMEYFVLQNTRLGVVIAMAKVISQAVTLAITGLAQAELQYETEMLIKKESVSSRWGALFRGRAAP